MLLSVIAISLLFSSAFVESCETNLHNAPVIGILAQEYTGKFKDYGNSKSYIAASYVKFVESAGGRVIPIEIDKGDDYYDNLFQGLNGVLLPGGSVSLETSNHSKVGRWFYNRAVEANKNGDYFPIWGSCLGFEFLATLAANNVSVLTKCMAQNQPANVQFVPTYDRLANETRLFKGLSKDHYNALQNLNVTANFHYKCFTRDTLHAYNLDQFFNVIAYARDMNGLEYISIFEARDFPFYGVQFHPEKNMFELIELVEHNLIPHDALSIEISQFMANFFINEARKSKHCFDSAKLRDLLIYNHKPEYTIDLEFFEQIYFFPDSGSLLNKISIPLFLMALICAKLL